MTTGFDNLDVLETKLDTVEKIPSFQYETVTTILMIIARILIVIARQM